MVGETCLTLDTQAQASSSGRQALERSVELTLQLYAAGTLGPEQVADIAARGDASFSEHTLSHKSSVLKRSEAQATPDADKDELDADTEAAARDRGERGSHAAGALSAYGPVATQEDGERVVRGGWRPAASPGWVRVRVSKVTHTRTHTRTHARTHTCTSCVPVRVSVSSGVSSAHEGQVPDVLGGMSHNLPPEVMYTYMIDLYLRIHKHTYLHAFVRTYIHPFIHTYITNIHTYKHACIHTHTHTHIHTPP